ncbi:MAG: fibronectin type III domain-containing protein [Methanomassiliicoccales archaeon]|nr:fibronectin type III domain-containing protein [Methanomassiliicoccales archaeon]
MAAVLLATLLIVSAVLSLYFVFYYEGPVPRDHSHPPALDLNVTEKSDRLQLEWNLIPWDNEWGLYKFNIYRCYNAEDMVKIGEVDIYHTSYRDYEVQRYRMCWYYIEAVQDPHVLRPDGSNYSPAFGSFGPISLGKRTADAPSGLSACPMDEKVAIYWNGPAIDGGHWVTSYQVYRGTSLESLVRVGNQSAQAVHYGDAFYDQNLTNDLTYFYAVSADNTIGESNLSAPISVTPRVAPQITVTWLSPDTDYYHQLLQIDWNCSENSLSNITGYQLYISQGPISSGMHLVESYSANQTSPIMVDLTYPYSWGILFMSAEYDDGNRSFSEPIPSLTQPPIDGPIGFDYLSLIIVFLMVVTAAGVIVAILIRFKNKGA